MIKVVIWDVQHGHATYLQTPTRHIVFDLGTGSYGSNKEFSPLLHLKSKYDVNKLDCVVITHPHRDHLDDILNFDALSPQVLLRPKHLSEDNVREANPGDDCEIIDTYLEVSDRYNTTISSADSPLRSENNGGVDIRTFVPSKCSRSNINNHSVVTVIGHASLKMLIPGDNEPPSWNELLEDQNFVSAIKGVDILMAPHHGRDSGFSKELFEHISPKLVIVSDGRFCDTSATARYSRKSSGWQVHKRDGRTEERKCLTTRNDGVIVAEFGMTDAFKPYMQVTID